MIVQNKNVAIYVFLSLSLVSTLFPPCNWGEEMLRTERERFINSNLGLPIKEYSFIFSDNKKVFKFDWDNYQQISIQKAYTLHRTILFSELIIEYILVFIISVISFYIVPRLQFRKLIKVKK